MRSSIRAITLFLFSISSLPAQSGAPQTSAGKPLFTFRSGFWINLHHFLYVLGRARNETKDSHRQAVAGAPADLQGFDAVAPAGRAAWDRALAYYQKNVSPMDAIFDRTLVDMTNALAAAGDEPSLSGVKIPGGMRTVLEDAAPVYRQVWWERHSKSNRAHTEELKALLDRYGSQVSDFITRVYQQSWPPEGLIVQVCAYANWAGAYSTSGRLIVVSSIGTGEAGSEGLEIIFHEAMHQWDDAMIPRLREAEERLHVDPPHELFHSLIFYTAGYAVQRAVPGHHPYADALWARGLPGKAQLDACWLPYLRGEGTLQQAIGRLVAAFPK